MCQGDKQPSPNGFSEPVASGKAYLSYTLVLPRLFRPFGEVDIHRNSA